ncbi:MAG: 3'-5' exonuclease [Gammaproteobacteria bacterium]
MNIFVFDIETIPDINAGRHLHNLPDLSDHDVAQAMYNQANNGEFLPHYLHQIAAISVLFRHQEKIKVWSLGETNASEAEIIQRFFDGIDRYTPCLVSWNGSGFDLPVLHYRALIHGINAARYWETGEHDNQFKWNNYLNRYHYRHLDVMDILAGYQTRANAPLDVIATLLGFPGKMGMHGSKVWSAYQAGDIAGIRNYCETDVLNTYLVYLRFEMMRGTLTTLEYERECALLRDYLTQQQLAHFDEFLEKWS